MASIELSQVNQSSPQIAPNIYVGPVSFTLITYVPYSDYFCLIHGVSLSHVASKGKTLSFPDVSTPPLLP